MNDIDIRIRQFSLKDVRAYLKMDTAEHNQDTISVIVDSILCGLPLPTIIICDDWEDDSSDVMKADILLGHHIIFNLLEFFNNKISIGELKRLPDYSHTNFNDLPFYLQNRIEDVLINVIVLGGDTTQIQKEYILNMYSTLR